MSDYAYDLTKQEAEGKTLRITKGLSAGNIQYPGQPRDFDWTVEHIIGPLVRSGKIGDGVPPYKWDDRKLRYNGVKVTDTEIEIPVGATHFHAGRADMQRDPKLNEYLQEIGLSVFNERYALFARPLGVCVLPITLDGSVFIGERTGQDHPDLLNGVAGYVTFRDPNSLNVQEDLERELQEEFGIAKDELLQSPRLVGTAYHPNNGEMDISFLVRVNKPDTYFSSGDWKSHVSEREHKNLAQLTNLAQVEELLRDGLVQGHKREIMYSTRLALESLAASDLRG
ncbi:hypothetical protein J4455_00865 [Candidatus Woesearchaeota archaeon]|nr:hypothetical protein [Candidatus Woesearchaeota archaeon]